MDLESKGLVYKGKTTMAKTEAKRLERKQLAEVNSIWGRNDSLLKTQNPFPTRKSCHNLLLRNPYPFDRTLKIFNQPATYSFYL